MKILKLTAENIKRLKAVEITPDPDGNLVIVSGRNDQGKTSVLDSIVYALAGGKSLPSRPIHDGERAAEIQLDLGSIIVTRKWTGNKTSYLKVESADGGTFSSPQAILNDLVGRLSFDPLEFSQLDAKARRATLLELANLDIDLDANATARQKMYDDRRDIGRDLKGLEAQIGSMEPLATGVPTEEKSVVKLSRQLQAEQSKATKLEELNRGLNTALANEEHLGQEITDLQHRLEEKQRDLESTRAVIATRRNDIEQAPQPDVDRIQAELDSVDEFNQCVRAAQSFWNLEIEIGDKNAAHAACQASIDALDRKKNDALANAQLPIAGLGITDDEVTFEDIPFDQLASSKQLRISLAMAMALNPKLKVIRITNGSLLDSGSLKLIEEMIGEKGYQLWLEIVDESGKLGIVIEDGMVITRERAVQRAG